MKFLTIEFHPSGVSHGKVGNHHYFLSWREPWNKFEDWDWFNGRNFCRERCMDLISFDTPGEYRMFEEVMIAGRLDQTGVDHDTWRPLLCLRSIPSFSLNECPESLSQVLHAIGD